MKVFCLFCYAVGAVAATAAAVGKNTKILNLTVNHGMLAYRTRAHTLQALARSMVVIGRSCRNPRVSLAGPPFVYTVAYFLFPLVNAVCVKGFVSAAGFLSWPGPFEKFYIPPLRSSARAWPEHC